MNMLACTVKLRFQTGFQHPKNSLCYQLILWLKPLPHMTVCKICFNQFYTVQGYVNQRIQTPKIKISLLVCTIVRYTSLSCSLSNRMLWDVTLQCKFTGRSGFTLDIYLMSSDKRVLNSYSCVLITPLKQALSCFQTPQPQQTNLYLLHKNVLCKKL